MEQLSEEQLKLLLTKEWLAKTASNKPYLFKFCSSTVDLSCLVLITDTKSVWVEALNSNQFARRWRECNSLPLEPAESEGEEDDWRESALKTLTSAHTLGGMNEFSFDTVESRYSDFAFELESESKAFKWRWETCFLGHKYGSEIISQHLVLPLISMNHLAFTSADGLGEMKEADLEKAIDKVGRTARRTVDTHIKNAVSRPRLASSLRRMTAMFNQSTELPPIIATAETPDLSPPSPPVSRKDLKARAPSPKGASPSPPPSAKPSKSKQRRSPSPLPQRPKSPDVAASGKQPVKLDTPSPEPLPRPKSPKAASPIAVAKEEKKEESVTESESDDDQPVPVTSSGKAKASPVSIEELKSPLKAQTPPPRSQPQSSQGGRARKSSIEAESSPPRPVKKKKAVASDSDDSEEEEAKTRRPSVKPTSGAVKRGTRQPIKRGGKRF